MSVPPSPKRRVRERRGTPVVGPPGVRWAPGAVGVVAVERCGVVRSEGGPSGVPDAAAPGVLPELGVVLPELGVTRGDVEGAPGSARGPGPWRRAGPGPRAGLERRAGPGRRGLGSGGRASSSSGPAANIWNRTTRTTTSTRMLTSCVIPPPPRIPLRPPRCPTTPTLEPEPGAETGAQPPVSTPASGSRVVKKALYPSPHRVRRCRPEPGGARWSRRVLRGGGARGLGRPCTPSSIGGRLGA